MGGSLLVASMSKENAKHFSSQTCEGIIPEDFEEIFSFLKNDTFGQKMSCSICIKIIQSK